MQFFGKSLALLCAVGVCAAVVPVHAQMMDPNTQRYYVSPQPLPKAGEFVRVPPPVSSYYVPPPLNSRVKSVTPDVYDYKPPKAVDKGVSDKYSLATKTGADIGFQFSIHHYQEPDIDVTSDSLKYGVNPAVAARLWGTWFFKADGRFALGSADYEGSGTSEDNPDYISEIRGVIGHDFLFRDFSITPSLGLGYRYQYNDARATSSTGAAGYRRYSHYLYMPVALSGKVRMGTVDRLAWSFEYDYLIKGRQFSELSDANSALPDFDNDQNTGYGLRGELMYQWSSWAFGPFFNYWNINDSEQVCQTVGSTPFCGVEPHNQTTEFGIQLRYKIF